MFSLALNFSTKISKTPKIDVYPKDHTLYIPWFHLLSKLLSTLAWRKFTFSLQTLYQHPHSKDSSLEKWAHLLHMAIVMVKWTVVTLFPLWLPVFSDWTWSYERHRSKQILFVWSSRVSKSSKAINTNKFSPFVASLFQDMVLCLQFQV